MAEQIEIVVNGRPQLLKAGLSVAQWAETLGVPLALLLIEYNRRAIHRDEWAHTILHSGDRLEILKIAAGG